MSSSGKEASTDVCRSAQSAAKADQRGFIEIRLGPKTHLKDGYLAAADRHD
jgi:hypothetical protein